MIFRPPLHSFTVVVRLSCHKAKRRYTGHGRAAPRPNRQPLLHPFIAGIRSNCPEANLRRICWPQPLRLGLIEETYAIRCDFAENKTSHE